MIGNAFLKRLMFQLDFLSEEDRQVVVEFYQKKLSNASTLTEEEEIVKTFGSPEHIAEKLKETYENYLNSLAKKSVEAPAAAEDNDSLKDDEGADACTPVDKEEENEGDMPREPSLATEESSSAASEDVTTPTDKKDESAPDENTERTDEDGDNAPSAETDVIFSKPITEEKAPEVIHSLESGESVPLYGEKVIIEERVAPIEEIPLEPIDRENGLTPEEIELAKAETLEKTENYHTATIEIPPESPLSTEKTEYTPTDKKEEEPSEDENHPNLDDEIDDEDDAKESEEDGEYHPGIFDKMFASASISHKTLVFFKVLLSILISPFILITFGGILLLYSVTTAFIILLGVILFALMVCLIIGGVVELVYGFAMLFESVSVALIEIGLGTVLFAFVSAIAAMIYEFLFGVLPRAIKGLTGLCKKFLKKVSIYLYGGNA